MNASGSSHSPIESGGMKFLRLLGLLVARTRAEAIGWVVAEYPSREPYRIGKATCRAGPVGLTILDTDGGMHLFAESEEHGSFTLVSGPSTVELFRDLRFLVFGGGDRQATLDAALEALEGVPA